MKKIYLLIFMLSITAVTFGQIFLSEDFSSNQMPPASWTIDGLSAQWSVSNTNSAGGTKPEGKFTYTNANSTTRLISPVVDLTGYTSVTLGFSHFYDDYTGTGPKLGVATKSQGSAWHVAWEIDPTSDVGPENLMITLDNEDVGQADFQFCFYLTGNFYNMDYWFVDNIKVYIPFDLDAELTAITSPTYTFGSMQVKGIVSNAGLNNLNSFDVNWQVGDGPVNTTPFSGLSIEMGEKYLFTSDQDFDFPIGEYELNVWLTNINGGEDQNLENNLLVKVINVASATDARKPMLEEFTSSTCAPCASFNTTFVPWCNTHADEITLVKYQMDWPGAGDPYYTEQGGERRGYYGVTWVPWLVGDGSFVETSIGDVNTFFNSSMATPSFASTVSSHTLDGTEISYTTTVLPYANLTDYRVLIVVFENVTTENVASNGETEFHHVMMKMIPDAEGFVVDFQDRVPVTFTGSMDLAGTNVEEWDDLGVAVIVQDYSSTFVQQSAYSVENGAFSTEARLDDLTIDGVSVPDFSPETLDYNIELPEGTTTVPPVTGSAMSASAKLVVVPATELPGTSSVYCFAEDLSTYLVYTINFTIAVGIETPKAETVRVYPNPASGQLNISGAEGATITILDLTGKEVASFDRLNSGKLDLSDFSNGIYFLHIEFSDQSTTVKKITILK